MWWKILLGMWVLSLIVLAIEFKNAPEMDDHI